MQFLGIRRGKSLIERFEIVTNEAPCLLLRNHFFISICRKAKIYRVGNPPIFVPSVARYKQGMIVQVPIHLSKNLGVVGSSQKIHDALSQHYDGSKFITVNPLDTAQGLVEISPKT